MLLLSSLLGPAKPPVASREDVASASGTYRVRRSEDAMVATAVQGLGQIRLGPCERCLVCLEDYQGEEELRRLTKCSHLFHRECIDQVSRSSFLLSQFGADLWYSGLLQAVTLVLSAEVRVLTRKRKVNQDVASHPRLVALGWHHEQYQFIKHNASLYRCSISEVKRRTAMTG